MEKGGLAGEPLVSVIIPTWKSASTLPALLESLSHQTMGDFETIIVDNHSCDGTDGIAHKWDAGYIDIKAGRSEARNRGASASRGRYLLFLDSDMELSPTVLEECCSKIERFDALCLHERSVTGGNYWAKARALERDGFFGSTYYESARFYRKHVFFDLGCYDTEMVGFEDLDLQAKLLEKGMRLGWADASVYHHEEGVGLVGYLRKRTLYSTTAGVYARRHESYWRELQSVSRRYRLLMKTMSSRDIGSAYLYPGLILMRSLEYFIVRRKT